MTLPELQARRDAILALAAKHGARDLRVFGSVARGEAGRESDLDLLVDMEPGRSLLDIAEAPIKPKPPSSQNTGLKPRANSTKPTCVG